MNLNEKELKAIKFLGEKGNVFRKASESIDKINNEFTDSLLKETLNLSIDETRKIIEGLDKKGLVVQYFDSAYIQLNNQGEKIYLENLV